MTRDEQFDQIHSLHLYIADRFKLMQTYSLSLNDPENPEKTLLILKKIDDTEAEIQMAYSQIDDIQAEPLTEDEFSEAEDLANALDPF